MKIENLDKRALTINKIKRYWIYELFFAIFLFLSLSFILNTGYWSDDKNMNFYQEYFNAEK